MAKMTARMATLTRAVMVMEMGERPIDLKNCSVEVCPLLAATSSEEEPEVDVEGEEVVVVDPPLKAVAAAERETAAEAEEAASRDDEEAAAWLEDASAPVETAAMRLEARLKIFPLLDEAEEAEETLREEHESAGRRGRAKRGRTYGREVARGEALDALMILESAAAAERVSEDEATTAIRLEASEKMTSDELAAEEGRMATCEAL